MLIEQLTNKGFTLTMLLWYNTVKKHEGFRQIVVLSDTSETCLPVKNMEHFKLVTTVTVLLGGSLCLDVIKHTTMWLV